VRNRRNHPRKTTRDVTSGQKLKVKTKVYIRIIRNKPITNISQPTPKYSNRTTRRRAILASAVEKERTHESSYLRQDSKKVDQG
jgi:hypothetical protein